MFDETMHPSDQDLLLCADGESSRRRASMVRRHLEACWSCRARMAEMQRTIGDFVRVHQQGLDSRIPPIDGPRAFLKLQLSAAEQQVRRAPWWRLRFALHPSHLAVVCALALALMIGSGVVYLQTRALPSSALPNAELLPNRSLTPGVTGPLLWAISAPWTTTPWCFRFPTSCGIGCFKNMGCGIPRPTTMKWTS